jgi:hypothetical protein
MQAYAKLQTYDRTASTPSWGTTHYIAAESIISLECSFLAYRCEKNARVIVSSIGTQDAASTSPTNDVGLVTLANREAGAMYRLNIYAEDGETLMSEYPATWTDQMLYWSGLVDGINTREDDAASSIEITAVGWSEYLASVTNYATDEEVGFDSSLTVLGALTQLYLGELTDQWPINPGAPLSASVDAGGTATTQLIGSDLGRNGFTALGVLQSLASLGNYFFGIRCSGYPVQETSEFTLVFLESRASIETNSNTRDTHATYAVASDLNVTDLSLRTDNFDYANQWLVRGATPSIEFITTASLLTSTATQAIATSTIDADYRLEIYNEGSPSLSQGWYALGVTQIRPAYAFRSDGSAHGGIPFGDTYTTVDGIERVAGALGAVASFDASYDAVLGIASGTYTTDPIPIASTGFGVNPLEPDFTTFTFLDGPPSWLDQPFITNTGVTRKQIVFRIASINRPLSATVTSLADGRVRRTQTIVDANLSAEVDMVLAATRSLWNERLESASGSLVVTNQRRLPAGQTANRIQINTAEDKATIMANAGGEFAQGQDARPVGGGKAFSVQQVTCQLGEVGWAYSYTLGAAPVELATVILPTSERSVV